MAKIFKKVYSTPTSNTGSNRRWVALNNSYHYVSLGDSIAAGQAINSDWENSYGIESQYGENGNTRTVIVPGTYTDKICENFKSRGGEEAITAKSFAHSGDDVKDLINQLSQSSIQKALSSADLVTVCSGANEILPTALNKFEAYLTTGDLGPVTEAVTQKLDTIKTPENQNSYQSLLNVLNSKVNRSTKCVFTTVYNPYKELYIDPDTDGFLDPLLNWIPSMYIDIDNWIEEVVTSIPGVSGITIGGFNFGDDFDFGYPEVIYTDVPVVGSIPTGLKWVSVDLGFDLTNYIKNLILDSTEIRTVFKRLNAIGGEDGAVEGYVRELNNVISNTVNNYKSTNPNFSVVDTKYTFDNYNNDYTDLVSVPFTADYDIAKMPWGNIWPEGHETYWNNLAWKHLTLKVTDYWSIPWAYSIDVFGYSFGILPSANPFDYIEFDVNGFITEFVNDIIQKVIMPNVDPHPKADGHQIMYDLFSAEI